MAKGKKKPEPDLSDLVALAEEPGVGSDRFEGDVEDAADTAASMAVENANEGGLCIQFEYLLSEGMDPGRLEEIIRQYAAEPEVKD